MSRTLQKRPRRGRSAVRAIAYAGFATAVALGAGEARAAIITDASFFDELASTTITFDTNGVGAPVSLIQGQSQAMPLSEYAGQGVGFANQVRWVNDGNGSFDAAQSLIGLGEIAIPSSLVGSFTINFSTPVFAFGFWIINNDQATSMRPTLTARAAGGAFIETATFSGPAIDGVVGAASYGFLGVSSETPIASVVVAKEAAILDNLRFAPIPTPGAGATLLTVGLLAAIRRRR